MVGTRTPAFKSECKQQQGNSSAVVDLPPSTPSTPAHCSPVHLEDSLNILLICLQARASGWLPTQALLTAVSCAEEGPARKHARTMLHVLPACSVCLNAGRCSDLTRTLAWCTAEPSRTPPPAGGGAGASSSLPGFGPLASGGQKLNTPTKKPGGGSAAQGVTDVYEFPWDDDDQEQAAIAGQRSKPAANGRPAAGPATNRPGTAGAAAAAAGAGRPKARPGSTVARKLKIPGEQEQPQAPAIQRAGASLSRINGLDHDAATARSLAGAFPAELAAAHPAPLWGPQQHTQGGGKQLGIKQFTRVMPPARSAFASGPLPAGMLNHGNTCYLNAILQVRACW